jgi:Uma2 family endonuclease
MATKALLTVEQYEQLPDTGVRTELVDGEVIELATETFEHNFARDEIRAGLRSAGAGVAAAEIEFRTLPGCVRRADVVWFRRLAAEDWKRHILPVPDLAVEVASPSDSAVDMRLKIHEYLDAGVTTVWFVYPGTGEADIWNRDGRSHMGVRVLTADCLPGFELPLAALSLYGDDAAPAQ